MVVHPAADDAVDAAERQPPRSARRSTGLRNWSRVSGSDSDGHQVVGVHRRPAQFCRQVEVDLPIMAVNSPASYATTPRTTVAPSGPCNSTTSPPENVPLRP